VDTAVPDSAGDFPSRGVRSVPLLPVGHSTTTDGARFLSRLNTIGGVASIVLPHTPAGVVSVAENVQAKCAGAVSPPYSVRFAHFVEEGGLAPSPQKLKSSRTSSGPWATTPMIPLASVGLLQPVLAAAAMAISSVSVLTNSLLFRRYDPETDYKLLGLFGR
jgi:hypothetical protein